MSRALKRLSLLGTAAGTVLVLFAGPAGAGSSSSMSAGATDDAATAAASTAAAVADGQVQSTSPDLAAAAVSFRVFNATCTSTQVKFTARTQENGFSGVQRFRQRTQLQEFVGGRWVARSPFTNALSTTFPNDGRNFFFTRVWRGTHSATGRSWRTVWDAQYLSGSGQVLFFVNPPVTVTCP